MAATGSLANIVAASPTTPGGGILTAPAGTALPTDATTALNAAFKPLGYVTDEGVTVTPTVNTSEERAWGGQVVKVTTTDSSVEAGFTFYEILSADVLRAAYGAGAVTVTPATSSKGEQVTLTFKGELPAPAPYVIEAKDGLKRIRVVFPLLQITEQGEIVLNSSESTKPSLAATAYPDATGALMYIYTDDGVKTGS